MQSKLIDSVGALETFLDGLPESKAGPLRLYVDLEGNNLSRNGTLSLVTILVESEKKVYLIDVTTLQQDAFNIGGSKGRTLREVLESSVTIKVFFDIRNDSDALHSLYGIRVAGIEDLQLMELASRGFSRRCVNGLAKCIERDTALGSTERQRWQKVKDRGRELFDPARGGNYAVFDRRPLTADVMDYCVQDVVFMPHLREVYRAKLCDEWWSRIEAETQARIRLSQSPGFNGKGRHMAEGPRAWLNWWPTAEQKASRTLFENDVRKRAETFGASVGSSESGEGELEELSSMVGSMRLQVDQRSLWAIRDHVSDEEAGRGWTSNSYDSDEADSSRDLTACDSECGYCGRCPY